MFFFHNLLQTRSDYEFAEILCAIVTLALLIIFFALIVKSHDMFVDYYSFTIPKIFVGIVLAVAVICGLHFNTQKMNVTKLNIKEGYTIFINGVEVDADTINIDEYSNIKVDDKNQYIIITVE